MKQQYIPDAEEIIALSRDEIKKIQDNINKENLSKIDAAYKQGDITETEKEYLHHYYKDPMRLYREIYTVFFKIFGKAKKIEAFDIKTGDVKCASNGNPIVYNDLKNLTPFNCTRVTFNDGDNEISIIFAEMKSLDRTFTKTRQEFGSEYDDKIRKIIERYQRHEDRERLVEDMQNVPSTTSQLHDILRLTITCNFLSDVKKMKELFIQHKPGNKLLPHNSIVFENDEVQKETDYYVIPEEIRDSFEKPLDKNEKKYYDIKVLMHHLIKDFGNFETEIQLKIKTLFYGDAKTHPLYEKRRELFASISSNDPQEVNDMKKRTLRIYDKLTEKINKTALHQYNMSVLDYVLSKEHNQCIPLQYKINTDGTYDDCIEFIENNYKEESYDDFDPQTAFSMDNTINKICFLRLIEALPQTFNELSEDATKQIDDTFSRLGNDDIERFKNINEVAKRYQKTIQEIINERKIKDGKMPQPKTKKRNKKLSPRLRKAMTRT